MIKVSKMYLKVQGIQKVHKGPRYHKSINRTKVSKMYLKVKGVQHIPKWPRCLKGFFWMGTDRHTDTHVNTMTRPVSCWGMVWWLGGMHNAGRALLEWVFLLWLCTREIISAILYYARNNYQIFPLTDGQSWRDWGVLAKISWNILSMFDGI